MINRNNFMGLDGFVWWFGVVENRKDPLSLGRCQVRIFGWHTEDKNQIPTSDLPWAHPILPLSTNSSTVSSAREGNMVFGFFLDSDDAQFPVMLGIVPGIPEFTPRMDKGFSDPRNDTELSQSPQIPGQKTYSTDGKGVTFLNTEPARFPYYTNEPTISRLARNQEIDSTFIGERKKTSIKNVLTASEGYWNEPVTRYNAIYPYNHVYESESGHIMEFDDTPGAERVHIAHRSGTFDEMYPDGTRVTKVTKDKYEVIMSDNNINVFGDCNITVNGKAALFIRGDADLKVGGDMTTSVKGTYQVVSTGEMKFVAPRIDFNPPGATAKYVEQTYTPENAVIERRQVPGGTGSFTFAGVTMNVSPDISNVPGVLEDGKADVPNDQPPANVANNEPVTCGDFSEPLSEADYSKRLSANFTLKQMCMSGSEMFRIRTQKTKAGVLAKESDAACNLQALCERVLEPIRARFGPLTITSGWRLGEDQAQHGLGEACDFQIGKNRKELLDVVLWIKNNLNYDQLIYEVPDLNSGQKYARIANGWIHVSYRRSGNRTSSDPNKNITFDGKNYLTQSEVPWEKINFVTDSRDNSLRPNFAQFNTKLSRLA